MNVRPDWNRRQFLQTTALAASALPLMGPAAGSASGILKSLPERWPLEGSFVSSQLRHLAVEKKAQALAAANTQQEAQLDQQRQLLDLVATLETHASPLAEGVLFAPIVGHLDARRAEALTSRLLAEVSAQRARLIILDIAGVSAIDSTVARALLNTAQALRLLGCAVTLSGISADVALAFTRLGATFDDVATARSPQEALALYAAQRATE